MSEDKLHERAKRIEINANFASVAEFITQYATNISTTGCFIQTREPLPIGSLVKLKFTVVTDEIQQIQGTGSVVRVSDDPPGMGIRFAYLTDESRVFIESLSERL